MFEGPIIDGRIQNIASGFRALVTMPDEALPEATDALVEGLNALMPGYRIVSQAIAITK
ncbi:MULTISPECIES: hypothetical protein [Mesorhizobium]|uniref:Uncharacterized protein n=2 Tax=Mesorhizobium TaxID=68287 RepID=A0A2P9AMS2_9HYPH|nr:MULTISPECIES: hypothetical protein [Mesorhizobium]CAH2402277.1 conserved hypothetical protein [Mesorhizobium escarrei]SJM32420.1 hypothetical protein BQ8482_290015 [Mesorhizobium delmotii]